MLGVRNNASVEMSYLVLYGEVLHAVPSETSELGRPDRHGHPFTILLSTLTDLIWGLISFS